MYIIDNVNVFGSKMVSDIIQNYRKRKLLFIWMGINFNLAGGISLVQLLAYLGASSFSEKIFEKKKKKKLMELLHVIYKFQNTN
jgi:predicted CopG family antitoxin